MKELKECYICIKESCDCNVHGNTKCIHGIRVTKECIECREDAISRGTLMR